MYGPVRYLGLGLGFLLFAENVSQKRYREKINQTSQLHESASC